MLKPQKNVKEPIPWLASDAYTDDYFRLHLGRYVVQDAFVRRRIYDLFRTVTISEGDWILDAGCGMGTVSLEAYKRGAHVVAVDYAASALVVARKFANHFFAPLEEHWQSERIRYVQGSIAQLPLPDQTFDVVIAADVVEHLSDGEFETFVRDAKRVLKRPGTLVIYTDNPLNWGAPICRTRLGKALLRRMQTDDYAVFRKWQIPLTYWTWPLEMIIEHDKQWEFVHVGLKDPRYLRRILLENGYVLEHFEIVRSGTYLGRLPYPANIWWGGMTMVKATL